MQYTPAQDHSAALIAWLHAYQCRHSTNYVSCVMAGRVAAALDGKSPHDTPLGMRLLTPARADAWLREHAASEPTSLLHGVVL